MTRRSRPAIPPIIRSRSAKKKLPTSASPPSTSSTRKALLRRRMVKSSSPAAAAAAVVAVVVDAAGVADAVDAVAADAVAALAGAVAALAGVAAASPGARAVRGAERGRLPRVIDANNQGRVRLCRPGLCMSTSGVVRSATCRDTTIPPNSPIIKKHPRADWIGGFLDPTEIPAFAGRRRSRVPCADS